MSKYPLCWLVVGALVGFIAVLVLNYRPHVAREPLSVVDNEGDIFQFVGRVVGPEEETNTFYSYVANGGPDSITAYFGKDVLPPRLDAKTFETQNGGDILVVEVGIKRPPSLWQRIREHFRKHKLGK